MMVVVIMRPTSLRREAQQVCLIFQTTAATSNRDRKQLERGQRRGIRSSIHQKSMIPAYSKQNTQKTHNVMMHRFTTQFLCFYCRVGDIFLISLQPPKKLPFNCMTADNESRL